MKIKELVKSLIPPILLRTRIRNRGITAPNIGWSGNFKSWSDASKSSTGYNEEKILEKCRSSLLQVKSGDAVYERDSVIFSEIQYSWGLLAGLERAALISNGHLCVLDFGGSLGSTYFQNRDFLSTVKSLKWCIVEQKNFVDCGKKDFESDQLKFYHTIEDCLQENKPNVLLLSSVLQYLEEPYQWVEKFLKLDIPTLLIDRTAFIVSEHDMLTVQEVPSEIYRASYPAWFFGSKLEKLIAHKYTLLARFDNGFTPAGLVNGEMARWNGMIFTK